MKSHARSKISEVDLAAKVISWLEADEWDVYQEVDGIDIVATRGPLLWTIECKLFLNFKVLEQAMRHRSYAHCSWVATPPRKRSRGIVTTFCSYSGIGWITVPERSKISVASRPEFNRRASSQLRKKLFPEQKTYSKAGSPTGYSWTPYKNTCSLLLSLVKLNPGIGMSDAMSRIKHHYSSDSSARSTIAKRLKDDVIPGVRYERINKKIHLFPS